MPRKLTPKQQAFVAEYLIDLNATAAARRAGYKGNNVDSIAAHLISKSHIQLAIQQCQSERAARCEVTADRVLKEFAAVAFSDLGDFFELTEDGVRFKPESSISESARRAVSSIKIRRELGSETRPAAETVEFRLWPKVDALTKLAQHLGLLKSDLSINVNNPIIKLYGGADPDAPLCPPQPMQLPNPATSNGRNGAHS